MKSKSVSFGTPGAYTVAHVYAVSLAQAVGTDLIHVPYTGGSKVLADLAGGQIDAGILKPSEARSEEHTSELQSLMRISYAVFCLKKKKKPEYTRTRS